MSQIKASFFGIVAASLVMLAVTGCSDVNKRSVLDPDTGKHAENWVTAHPAAYFADPSRCNGCHISEFVGGITAVSCGTASRGETSCHVAGSCKSCHESPPNGTDAPNRNGAHQGHYASALFPDGCATCHDGAGMGTLKHLNGAADVSLLNAYNAKSGTAAHNADGTCSKVSCHGGQTTPVWLTETIDVSKDCTKCHALNAAEYNGVVSGEHDFHVNTLKQTCTTCHDTAAAKLGASHFTHLDTPALEGPASATLQDFVNYSNGSCSPGCHGTRSWSTP